MTKEIIKKDDNVPSFIKNKQIDEDLLQVEPGKDIKISSLILVQGESHFAIEEGIAKKGDYIDNVVHKNYGSEVDIIVLKHTKSWVFRNQEEFLLSYDGINWDNGTPLTEDEKFLCLHHNFHVLVANDMQALPFNLTFKKQSIPSASNMLNVLYRNAKVNSEPIYSRIFTLSSVQEKLKNGNNVLKKIVNVKSYVNKEQFEFAENIATKLKDVNIEVKNKDNDDNTTEITID